MSNFPLHETLNVYVSSSAYVFEPASGVGAKAGLPGVIDEKDGRESLVIDRQTGSMSLSSTNEVPLGRDKIITCYGILGILTLATTDYILIITARTQSCRLLAQPIYTATDYRLLPLAPHATSAKLLDHPIERELIQLVEHGLKGSRLWFSYGWDLTNTLQRQSKSSTGPLWSRADERFFWNRFLVQRMIDQTESGGPDLGRFILPVMFGSFELRSSIINNRDVLFCLISRRSRHRAGTRYFTRGINHAGDCANFNETEQILLLDPLPVKARGRVDGTERLSFVQVRGSVPIFWAEVNNLRYKPDLQIMDVPETTNAITAHLRAQLALYGPVNLVNLVNQHGHEHPVKAAFEAAMSAAAEHDDNIARDARYTYFDFHKECKGLRFDRVSVLIDRLAKDLETMGYFHASANSAPNKLQNGVIRSNCMDCLDRTNVVQAAIGRHVLERQLRAVGVLAAHEALESNDEFMTMFRNVWADHADYISKAYSGTGALKTDYTRTGKRTKEGYLQDGVNSVMRYVRNNFFDGDRQDAYDILTGAWVAQRGAIVPLADTRPLLMRWMPYILAFALTLLAAVSVVPRDSTISSLVWLWIVMTFASAVYIWGNGVSYVSWPRLNPPVDTLSYKGAGFKTASRGRGLSFTKLGATLLKRGQSAAAKSRAKVEEVELGKKKGSLID